MASGERGSIKALRSLSKAAKGQLVRLLHTDGQ